MRVPWTAKRSNQSIPKEINPEYSLEGLMLKTPDGKTQLIGKDLDAGKKVNVGGQGAIEDEMVRWHYRRIGHEFE